MSNNKALDLVDLFRRRKRVLRGIGHTLSTRSMTRWNYHSTEAGNEQEKQCYRVKSD